MEEMDTIVIGILDERVNETRLWTMGPRDRES